MRLAAAGVGLALVGVAAAEAAADRTAGSPLRYLYVLPVVAAALRFGGPGGLLAGVAAAALQAPWLFPAIERSGLAPPVVERVVSLVTAPLAGALAGMLTGAARRERRRHALLLAAQIRWPDEPTLDVALERLRGRLAARLSADVALGLLDGERTLVAGAGGIAPGSAAHLVLDSGCPVFVPAVAGPGRRPAGRWRRALVVPLVARDRVVGVLAMERPGDIAPDERESVAALGLHLGLALENLRLAKRQRRFTEELARRVAAATRRLEELDRAKSAFVAVASHELRTPLTALVGFAALLAQRVFQPHETRRLAGILHRETERLARIVDDLLDLSRLERGLPLRLHRTAVAVGPALAAAVEVFAGAHDVRVECEAGVPPVDADPDAVDRIVKNLVANAVKYATGGAPVRVRARAVDGRVEIAVEDRGPGIPADALPHVFEPYYRAPATAAAVRGAGLGLAVVKALVDAHQGAVHVESAPGRGTRVVVVLPAAPADGGLP